MILLVSQVDKDIIMCKDQRSNLHIIDNLYVSDTNLDKSIVIILFLFIDMMCLVFLFLFIDMMYLVYMA